MIKFKRGVPKNVLSREMEEALEVTEDLYQVLGARHLWVTSTSDGKHMRKSKHYDLPFCNAADTRIWDILKAIAREISNQLGPDYDVVFEKDHFHIEYDPK